MLWLLAVVLLWLGLSWLLWQRERSARSTIISYADVLAAGLLLLLTIGFFWRTISGDVFQPADGGDLVSFLFPTYRFAAGQLSQWTLPLWNPTLYGGAPFISDIQAGFLYPPNLLLFLLNPEFDYPIMQWLVMGHLFWAGLGVYVLVRSLRFGAWQLSRPAALLAALAFQFSDPFLIHLGNLNLIAVLSWLPWVLAAYHRAQTRRSLRWAGIAALLWAIGNYAGHAQSTMYIGLALGVYTLCYLFTPPPGLPDHANKLNNTQHRSWGIQALIITVVLTVLLTAPILLPALELTQYTERSDFTYQDTVAFSLAPTQAIGLITPGFFGRGPALHWSLWERVELPYAGVVTLLLAILGLVLVDGATRRRLWPWVGVAVFGFVVGLGVYSILHGWLTVLVPGLGQFRAPARALVLWTLGVSMLAAVGVDAIIKLSIVDCQLLIVNGVCKWPGLVLGGVAVPLAYFALLVTQESETAFLRASVAALAIVVAAFFWLATWGVISAFRAGWMNSRIFASLLVGLLYAELTANGGAYLDVSPTDPTTGFEHPEIVDFLKRDPDLFRIDTRTDIQRFWQPDSAALYNLQDVGGIANPLMLQQWEAQWLATGGRQSRLYDMLNVKYVIVQDGVPLPEAADGRTKFELALDAPGELAVYRNVGFMPRAWWVPGVRSVTNTSSARSTIRADDFDPKREVVLLGISSEASDTGGSGSATISHYGSSEMTIDVQADAPGYLLVSEVWYPGWRATVNGASRDVMSANGALRAVAVSAGESTVQLWFAPSGWRWGSGLFVIGVVAFIVCILRGGWRWFTPIEQ